MKVKEVEIIVNPQNVNNVVGYKRENKKLVVDHSTKDIPIRIFGIIAIIIATKPSNQYKLARAAKTPIKTDVVT